MSHRIMKPRSPILVTLGVAAGLKSAAKRGILLIVGTSFVGTV
jgi:hypothetical protein